MEALPVDEVLPDLAQKLNEKPNLVLIAPPGAGKTTRVPGALLDEGLVSPCEQVWVLEPRRLATRMAAERLAAERQCPLGQEVGYQIRLESKQSKATRLVFMTEGVLTRRIQEDPSLEGVGAVILDEFHERSLHADMAIALLKEVQDSLRPELKIVVMSATLDPTPVANFLGECSVLRSEGRMYPVEINYLPQAEDKRVSEQAVSGVKKAIRDRNGQPGGDILVFLPGSGEIRQAAEKLEEDLGESLEVCPLYGELDRKLQDKAVGPRSHPGKPKIILSTNIAESSLTIQGVDTVVDTGVAKVNRYDAGLGADRLELLRISKYSAQQRTGRAGRLGPGRCYRTWDEKAHQRLPEQLPAEITRVDLSAPILEILRWSSQDPNLFSWFEAPPAASIKRSVQLLEGLGVIGSNSFRLNELGEQLAQLPLHPRQGKLMSQAAELGLLEEASYLAALAGERDIVSQREFLKDSVANSDLIDRMERLTAFSRGESPRSLRIDGHRAKQVLRTARQLRRISEKLFKVSKGAKRGEEKLLKLILHAYPDRVAKRLEGDAGRYALVGGTTARLGHYSLVKDSEYVVAVQVDAGQRGKGGFVRLASAVELDWLQGIGLGVQDIETARFDLKRELVEPVRRKVYLDLVLSEKVDSSLQVDSSAVLAEAARAQIDRALPVTDEFYAFLNRLEFVRRNNPELELEPFDVSIRERMLEQLCMGKRSFKALRETNLVSFITQTHPAGLSSVLRQYAPETIQVPSGSNIRLKYPAEGPPVLAVRLQEVFGLYDTPKVAGGRVPVRMELLAPNMRPVQVTQDLRSFWDSTYTDVRKELRRRYPKHQWPEDPKDGIASRRVRPKRSPQK